MMDNVETVTPSRDEPLQQDLHTPSFQEPGYNARRHIGSNATFATISPNAIPEQIHGYMYPNYITPTSSYYPPHGQAQLTAFQVAQQAYSQNVYHQGGLSGHYPYNKGYWAGSAQTAQSSPMIPTMQYMPVTIHYPGYLNESTSSSQHYCRPTYHISATLPVMQTTSAGAQRRPQRFSDNNLPMRNFPPISPAGLEGRSKSSLLKGPPRKPRQTGFAMWLGNLEGSTSLEEVLNYFSGENLVSVLMIKKSGCAFLNYVSELDVTEAVSRYNKTVFKNVEVSCHSRRTSHQTDQVKAAEDKAVTIETGLPDIAARISLPIRYFVLKSLDHLQLQISVQTGIWITQLHNVPILNGAFQNSQAVYLLFSANKTGEFYGYARMAAPIDPPSVERDQSKGTERQTDVQDREGRLAGSFKIRLFPTSGPLRKGSIYEDCERGSIFWEADDFPNNTKSAEQTTALPSGASSPFNVEWRKVGRISFNKTQNITNRWNSNREVKISRDGTELDTIAGHQLVRLFDQMGHFAPAPMYKPDLPAAAEIVVRSQAIDGKEEAFRRSDVLPQCSLSSIGRGSTSPDATEVIKGTIPEITVAS